MTTIDTGPVMVITNKDGDHLPLSRGQVEALIVWLKQEISAGKEFRKITLTYDSYYQGEGT